MGTLRRLRQPLEGRGASNPFAATALSAMMPFGGVEGGRMTPTDYLAMLKQMRWRDVQLLASSRSGSSVQQRLLHTQATIEAIEAALHEGQPEQKYSVDPDGFPLTV
jgi:hypothetical protein